MESTPTDLPAACTDSHTNEEEEDDPATPLQLQLQLQSLSRLAPPSHILPNGRPVHLPPATAADRAAHFARTVARHGLVRADGATSGGSGGGSGNGKAEGQAPKEGEEDNGSTNDASSAAHRGNSRSKKGETKSHSDTQIHPLAMASAALNHGGIAELSKSINLAGMLLRDDGPGAYLGLTNVISGQAEREALTMDAAAAAAAAVASAEGGTTGNDDPAAATTIPASIALSTTIAPQAKPDAAAAAAAAATDDQDAVATLLDRHHRSRYTLAHRTAALSSAATLLRRHHHRLRVGTTVQSIVDVRYRHLRPRWRLVAPEHGTQVRGAVRPEEVMAVDVEIYDRDRVGGGVGGSRSWTGGGGSSGGGNGGTRLGRIARRVPRFATVEVRDGYGLGREATEREAKRRRTAEPVEEVDANIEAEEKKDDDEKTRGAKDEDGDVEMKDAEEKGTSKGSDAANNAMEDAAAAAAAAANATNNKTIAEPYAVADPTVGKVDLDFDPDQVPLLTLSLSIERARTGYAEEVVLSSITSSGNANADSNGGKPRPDDEPVIYALQHSLFCASLFESMRGELSSAERAVPATNLGAPASTGSGSGGGGGGRAASSTAGGACWLAGGTDESFLPAPTRMDGAPPPEGGLGGTICVVHCHQGEVKVRLNAEYDLTVKLVEAGTVRSTSPSTGDTNSKKEEKSQADADSGSQSAAYLRTLCRALLLHAQSAYHGHRLRMHAKAMAVAAAEAAKAKSGLPPGLARRKKNAEEERPLILGGVLALGGKMLVERKVRESLRKLSRHISQQADMPHRLVVEWLTLSMFDTKSYFTASVGPAFTLDVCIDAGGMTVASFGDNGQYKSVRYGTADQFEMYMQLQIKRLTQVASQ